uniref:K Homology domain-containing protein n=1 Tax=Romanomermis culicivorax TaxID=13658 RepID=A0A915L147_ROMCU
MITKEFSVPAYTKERAKDYLDCLPRIFPNIVEVKERIVKITAKDQEECENVKEAVWNHFYEIDFTGFIAIFGRKDNVSQAIKMLNQMFDAQVLDDIRVDSRTANLKFKGEAVRQNYPEREETSPTKSFSNLRIQGNQTNEEDFSNKKDGLKTIWFKVRQDSVSLIIGRQGNKKREFEEKFNIRILIKNDLIDEKGVAVEVSGFSYDDLNKAREEMLYYVNRFDKNGSYSVQ